MSWLTLKRKLRYSRETVDLMHKKIDNIGRILEMVSD